MLPHRSDTSRGHLHPRRVATPRPFPSRRPFFPDLPFLSISRPISSIQRGCFSPVRPLMPPLSWGALARKPPFFPSQASLLPGTNPPPAIFNPVSFLPLLLSLLSALFSLVSFVLRRPMQPWPLCPRVKSRLARDYSGIRSRKSRFLYERKFINFFSPLLLILISLIP